VATQIDAIRQGFASQYLGYAEKYVDVDSGTTRRMLLKGLRYCPDDVALQENLALLAAKDFAKMRAAGDDEREEGRVLLGDWHDALEQHSVLTRCLGPDTVAVFYRQHAIMLLDRQEYAGALESLQAALTFTPDRPDLHISIADVCFALGNYAGGITHLTKAVACDRSYAQFWENMGDNLCRHGQIDAAITAYEQCFLALPEHLGLLKKIGDGYLALGQMEAAREAYLQLKDRLQSGGAEPHPSHPPLMTQASR
jgi:tetratricopeptide (TPR) repeat protein